MGYRPGVLLSMVFVCGNLLGCTDPAVEKAKAEKIKPTPVRPGPADPDAPEEFTTTESGLKYRIRRKTTGKMPDSDNLLATLHFRGWLDDGTIFDTSYGSGATARQLDLKGGLAGWVEGMKLIGEGGMIELEIPSKLAYGERPIPPLIPADATLHFLVEVFKLNESPKEPERKPGPGPSATFEPKNEPGPVDPDAPEEFTTTATGLKYRIRRKSDGKAPAHDSTVVAHYRGWLDSGGVFDTSYDLGQPREFSLRSVIKGWTEGLQLIGEGGMIELEIPHFLGYGPSGRPPQIPGSATLHFIIELVQVQ